MKVFNKIGSKERLLEIFENVNKIKLTEGVHDKGIFKAFILGGGPGSGKSYVVDNLFGFPDGLKRNLLSSHGLKLVSSDSVFEYMLEKENVDPKQLATISKTDPQAAEKILGDDPTSIRSRAKKVSDNRTMNYLDGRLGIIIDGTSSKNVLKNENLIHNLEMMGYEVYIIFVKTSLDVALQRNRTRSRRLDDKLVKKLWQQSMESINHYSKQRELGDTHRFLPDEHIIIVNNDGDIPIDTKLNSKINQIINKPVTNPTALKWIETEKKAGQDKTDRNKFKNHPSPEYVDFARTYRNRFKDTKDTDLGKEYNKHMDDIFGLPEA